MATYVPMVIVSDGRTERAFDIYSRLLKDRIIMLEGEVNDDMASIICSELLFLESEDKHKDISMYINSPGGSVTAGLAIYDTMRILQCDVATYSMGQACSMGAFLLAAGTKGKRTALESSRIMIHEVASGNQGKATDMKISMRETERLNDYLLTKISEFTGKDKSIVEKDCSRDYFMSANEALKYGLVDKIM